jgi:hypothetical protein
MLGRNQPTEEGEEIVDVMRFFHGDNPAQQYEFSQQEFSQQKGGNFYCSICGVHANNQLKKAELLRELNSRKLYERGKARIAEKARILRQHSEVNSRVDGPARLHHFCSSNFKDEEEHLKNICVFGKENCLTSSCVTDKRCQ